jgi:hypothetical protein
MTTDQENELFKRAQVIKAKCDEYLKYNGGSDDNAFALGVELLASGQLFTEAAGHACQPATSENHLMFGIKMTKDESAIIGLILNLMHKAFEPNNTVTPTNEGLISLLNFHTSALKDELAKPNTDLYDLNATVIKIMARLLYAAINLDLTKELTINKTDAAVKCLPSGHKGC